MLQIEKALETINTEYKRLIERNKSLQEENEHLKSEHYKDDELAAMRETTMNLYRRISHHGLIDKHWTEMQDWWNNHLNENHAIDVALDKKSAYKMPRTPGYKIEFEDFAECTCYSIVCNGCGKSHHIYY